MILSGLRGCGFHTDSVTHIESELDKLNKPWCHITSLSSRSHTHAERHMQLASFKPAISSVMNKFMRLEATLDKSG